MAKILWAHRLGEGEKHNALFLACVSVNLRSKKHLQFWSSVPSGDDLGKKGVQDDIRINIRQDWERQYWAKKFSITQKRLREVVKDAGPLVVNVMAALAK